MRWRTGLYLFPDVVRSSLRSVTFGCSGDRADSTIGTEYFIYSRILFGMSCSYVLTMFPAIFCTLNIMLCSFAGSCYCGILLLSYMLEWSFWFFIFPLHWTCSICCDRPRYLTKCDAISLNWLYQFPVCSIVNGCDLLCVIVSNIPASSVARYHIKLCLHVHGVSLKRTVEALVVVLYYVRNWYVMVYAVQILM